jgi:hypothetical protein
LREHSQRSGQKLSAIAAAVVESHLLLAPAANRTPAAPEPGLGVIDQL